RTIFGARRETEVDSPSHDRAPPRGQVAIGYGRHRRKSDALRSSGGTLQSCGASSAGDAFWSRLGSSDLVLSVVGSVVAWLSRGGARGHRPRDQECARNRSSWLADVRVGPYSADSY